MVIGVSSGRKTDEYIWGTVMTEEYKFTEVS